MRYRTSTTEVVSTETLARQWVQEADEALTRDLGGGWGRAIRWSLLDFHHSILCLRSQLPDTFGAAQVARAILADDGLQIRKGIVCTTVMGKGCNAEALTEAWRELANRRGWTK